MLTLKKVTALLGGALVLLIVASNQANASSKAYLGYIDKILGQLNNKEKCEMPTYAEIDDLSKSFEELRSVWGDEFDILLSADQKLVLGTVLDQWTSFQRYLTGESVTASAKKRAFLGKVERYQEGKHGFSICAQHPDDSVQKADSEYEKNPLVRYIKQLETDGSAVDAPKPTSEEGKKGTGGGQAAASSRGGPNGNDPSADEPDVVFKFKVHPDDPNQAVRQYGGQFTYRDGRTPHRITLNIHGKQ